MITEKIIEDYKIAVANYVNVKNMILRDYNDLVSNIENQIFICRTELLAHNNLIVTYTLEIVRGMLFIKDIIPKASIGEDNPFVKEYNMDILRDIIHETKEFKELESGFQKIYYTIPEEILDNE